MTVLIEEAEMAAVADIEKEEITEVKIEAIEAEIGTAQNVRILTLHSEKSAIAVKQTNLKETKERIAAVADIEKEEITEAEMAAVADIEKEEITEVKTEVIEGEIGPVQSVKIPILHSETNVIAVKLTNLKETKEEITEAEMAVKGKMEIIVGHQEKEAAEYSVVTIQVETLEEGVLEVQIDLEEEDFADQIGALIEETDQVEVVVEDDENLHNF